MPEDLIESAVFVLVAAESGISSSDASQYLLFGQPVCLRHAASGRYLCAGVADVARHCISQATAELAKENDMLSLLPDSLTWKSVQSELSCCVPQEHVLAECIFRFIPTTNFGRSEVHTDDNIFMVTESRRLIRAGIQPLPISSNTNKIFDTIGDKSEWQTKSIRPISNINASEPFLEATVDNNEPYPFDM